ncbi:MAG: MarR family transcriptional regulator [Cyclobacteriaceae bacterium]
MEENRLKDLYLDRQICFLLYAASRQATKVYGPLLKELDITYPQYLVLLVLWEHKEMKVSEIGNLLMLESNTLTPLLKRLEQRGFVFRLRSNTDERCVTISLTENGEKLKSKACTIPGKIADAFVDDSVSIPELQTFQKTLAKVVKVLHEKNTMLADSEL